ncbi:SGNH/GDSL hydrolase family protein [Ornithinimicrobium pratense]|uniref:SGNH/GDSL hydrolase family protein n=1 Tax=Ornithinimicrobium pratense TaxID=2593973 RepID=A0A5J6V3Z8_9MICO|nr:SGNH/GDSL hydrolase family protein [Ornithinimicrobium pratense]QFG67891.1 SGNH/GDSL hydrolase family protein [Ornithinimicrobium pratense]
MNTPHPGRRHLLIVAGCGLALAAASAFPANGSPQRFVYDALGDSFASGSGAAAAQDACGRNDLAYPHVLDGRMRIALDDFAACGGATIPSMLATQMAALGTETDLVTVSIGGNDIGWSAAVTACLVGTEAQCAQSIQATTQSIEQQLPADLGAAYTQIRVAAPDAHVVVTGYPRLFSPEHGDFVPFPQLPGMISVAEQRLLNDGADLLNAVIADVAADHGFQFVDVTSRFTGHGVNAGDAWLTGLDHPVPLHPTAEGQHAYGVALRSQINPTSLR